MPSLSDLNNLSKPPAIGSDTPNTGAFTTITATTSGTFDGTIVSDDSVVFSQSSITDYIGHLEYDTLSVNRDHRFYAGGALRLSFDMNDGDIINALTSSGIYFGSASPEGGQTAGVGSIYLRSGGGASTSFYVKESGTGNTGWVAK